MAKPIHDGFAVRSRNITKNKTVFCYIPFSSINASIPVDQAWQSE